MTQRRYELDFLKALGLLCIILAHVDRPAFISQLRSFDVPMMVMLSAMLARLSFERSGKKISLRQYIPKRFARLVLPTWIFLTFFFLYLAITHALPAPKKILRSYLLADSSIGYVWIVSVYMVCALLTPFALHIDLNKRSHALLVVGVYLVHEILCSFKIYLPHDLLNDLLFYIIPYGSVIVLGLNYDRLSEKGKNTVMMLSACIYAVMAVYLTKENGTYVHTNTWKYPARIYYLSYAIAGSFFLLKLCTKYRECRLFRCRLVRFLSSSSLWIYLWHIFMLKVIVGPSWLPRFLLITIASCFAVWGQLQLTDYLERKGVNKSILSVFRG